MLRKLSRDYWPEGTDQPAIRVLLAILGGPIIIVPLALLLMLVVDFAIYRDFPGAQQQAFGVAPYLLAASYTITLTLGLIAFFLLWALRLRGRRAFIVAGLAVGLSAAALAPLIGGPTITPVTGITMALYFACVMLAMRWVAGIRRVDADKLP